MFRSFRPWSRLPVLSLAVLGLSLSACGSNVGGGGSGGFGSNLGAPAGTACASNLFNEGCYVSASGVASRMACVPGAAPGAPGTWTLTETCGAGTICVQNPDPATPNKKVTVCQAAPTGNPGTDTGTSGGDAGTGKDTTTGSGDSTSGDTGGQGADGKDSGGEDGIVIIDDTGGSTPLSCIQEGCPDAWASCKANAQCESLATCMINCGADDTSCQQACFNQATGNAKSLLVGVLSCAGEKGCLGASTGPTCGNGSCESGETKSSCPADCGTTSPVCGDGLCNGSETKATCPKDCGTTSPVCGDGLCNGSETKATCPKDCGTTTGTCGDGTCGSGENATSCAQDCDPTTKCVFDACGGEIDACGTDCQTFYSCASACGSNNTCVQNCLAKLTSAGKSQVQTLEQCKTDSGCFDSSGSCGDGTCGSGETASSCPADCGSSTCVSDNCPSEIAACQKNTSCTAMFQCFQSCADGDQTCLGACYNKAGATAQGLYSDIATCAQDNGCQ